MLEIYDCHMHCDGTKTPDADGLLHSLNEAGVTGACIFSEAPFHYSLTEEVDFEKRMKFVFDWCRGHEDVLFPVYWVHPDEKDVLARVEEAAKRGIVAYKMICDTFRVGDKKCLELCEKIAELNKPIFFHSGSLYDDVYATPSSAGNNRPSNWEDMMQMRHPLRFSMAHCGWPWTDEFMALYGKLNYMGNVKAPADRRITLYADTTPGTPLFQRPDLFRKLHLFNNDFTRVMYGSDLNTDSYGERIGISKRMIAHDLTFAELADCTMDQVQLYFKDNLLRFLGKE